MVYDWDDKKELCYRLYIVEKKSLDDIMKYMKLNHDFAPSKRAFQTTFKRWQFPSKQNPAHRNDALVKRVGELWEANYSQADTLNILRQEGFDIKERELMRLRSKKRWLLREPNKNKRGAPKAHGDDGADGPFQPAHYPEGQPPADTEAPSLHAEDHGKAEDEEGNEDDLVPPLSPTTAAAREENKTRMAAESAQRWSNNTRRRRTRPWAGMPADPAGPARYPSETTIDESKVLLGLDNNGYREVRERFQNVCEMAGVVKKTLAGPQQWDALKSQLIEESPHLREQFAVPGEEIESKRLALDIICTDVTKRMRTVGRRMTIKDAKVALGVNPDQARKIRADFYLILRRDHFRSKLEAGEEHWRQLKLKWIDASPLLQEKLGGNHIPDNPELAKALEVICRDVMKRLRDDHTKRESQKKRRVSDIGGPSPDDFTTASADVMPQFNDTYDVEAHANLLQAAEGELPIGVHDQADAHAHAHAHTHAGDGLMADDTDMRIDPSLFIVAANNASLLNQGLHAQYPEQQYPAQQYAQAAAEAAQYSPATRQVAVYFRIDPASTVDAHTRMWVRTLSLFTMDEVREAALSKYPYAQIIRVEGIVREHNGGEVAIPVDDDDELRAYLTVNSKLILSLTLSA